MPPQKSLLANATLRLDEWQEPVATQPTASAQPLVFSIGKRGMDVVFSAVLLLACVPLLAIAALLIALVDGRPIIFWQRRVGRGGREFWFPKLRSMHNGSDRLQHALRPHANWPDSVTFKMWNDPRVTRLGRSLRVLSIDELPQLWCVLKGDMSLVGPRPPLPEEVAQYTAAELRRLAVRPGLTCLWQVSGRSILPFQEQVALDLWYIEHQSLWLDLKLMARTIPAILSCTGAF